MCAGRGDPVPHQSAAIAGGRGGGQEKFPTDRPGCCPVAPLPALAVPIPPGNTAPGTAQCLGAVALSLPAVAPRKCTIVKALSHTSTAVLLVTWHSSKYLREISATPALPCSRSASCSRLPAHTSPFTSSSTTLP